MDRFGRALESMVALRVPVVVVFVDDSRIDDEARRRIAVQGFVRFLHRAHGVEACGRPLDDADK